VALKRISSVAGLAALAAWSSQSAATQDIATAVRYCLQELKDKAPGNSVEVRVPPFGAAQVIAGTSHTRGTPPAAVEMPAEVWLQLSVGTLDFDAAKNLGLLRASGQRSDLSALFPIVRLP
jgi:hypothetical protein